MDRLPDDAAVAPPRGSGGGARPELPAQAIDAWALQTASLSIEGIVMEATLQRSLRLQEPLNAAVRGLLGARLRDLRCLTRAPLCQGCGEVAQCDYVRIFETPAALTSGAHGSHETHPFWLRGLPAVQQIAAGDEGDGAALGGGVCPARHRVSRRLAARRMGAPRACGGGAVGVAGAPGVRGSNATPRARASADREDAVDARGDGTRAAQDCPAAPWLALLVRAGVRRVLSLRSAYAPEPPQDRALFPDLRGVALVEGEWSVWKGSRCSVRQAQRVPPAGWVGSAVVRGAAVEALSPLLDVLTVVNVGKGTTMGFGELQVEPCSQARGGWEIA